MCKSTADASIMVARRSASVASERERMGRGEREERERRVRGRRRGGGRKGEKRGVGKWGKGEEWERGEGGIIINKLPV